MAHHQHQNSLLLVGSVLLLSLASHAQEDASSRFVATFDKDGDGKLTVREFPAQFRGAFQHLDKNRDGVITADEHRQDRQAVEAQHKQAQDQINGIFKARDEDDDGKLAESELPPWAQRSLPKADTDGDGSLTRKELTALRLKLNRRLAAQKTKKERMKPPMPATHPNIAYGDHEKQRFDLWVAESATPTPLVIYIHGGGFRSGDKAGVNGPLVGKLLAKGIAFASMNYRLTDVGPYPMQMHDCARGLQTIRHRASEFNINPARIGLTGGSAGSGISQWLAFHDDLADPESQDIISRQSTRVRCAAPYNAQCSYDPRFISKLFDTDQMHGCFPAFFGAESKADVFNPRFFPLFEDASPITHLSADDVPIFLYYNQANNPLPKNSTAAEHIHHPKFGFHLKEKMDALGIECTLRLREQSPYLRDDEVTEFFVKHLTTK